MIVFRRKGDDGEVLLIHPGGPFWAKKDVWSIPKGELEEDESHISALTREFKEETGLQPPLDNLIDLGSAKASSKENHVWAVEGDLDISKFHCGSMAEIEWPPRSGKKMSFPENDKAEWKSLWDAHSKVYKSQQVFIERLAAELSIDLAQPPGADDPQIALDL